jgi:hypothetical protein
MRGGVLWIVHAADVPEHSAHACPGILCLQEISHLHFVRKGNYYLRLVQITMDGVQAIR